MIEKAIVLDRDGVLIDNSQQYYIWNKEQLEFIDGIVDNLKKLQEKGYSLFIVTNQGGIAKGLYGKEDVYSIHRSILEKLMTHGINIVDFLFCPHHDSIAKCLCRKPESLMLERIIAKYSLDKNNTCFIGDNVTDMMAAEKAGIKGIKVESNKNMRPYITELLK